MKSENSHSIYLEVGKKRTFACAIEWPGWCRSARDEASAVQALYSYAPRYADIVKKTDLVFILPETPNNISVINRIGGNFATDFGVPDLPQPSDASPLSEEELQRFSKILQACWAAFDGAVYSAEGKMLRKGPRGGGRELEQIIDHIANAEKGYLRRLGCPAVKTEEADIRKRLGKAHAEILKGMQAAAHGQLPAEGPQGGRRWPLRYFIRRVAWHVVDHAWEIEDRII